jgi:uncharacterized protein
VADATERFDKARETVVPATDNADRREFWAASTHGELVVRQCDNCGRTIHLPRPVCGHCGAERSSWRRVGPLGLLESWTTVERSPDPAFPAPYTVVVVRLRDEPTVRLVGHAPGRGPWRADQSMRAVFEQRAGGIVLPNWVPADAPQAGYSQ